jgi:hypothetical protein
MSSDPGLANDTCIFVEAISGDGGVHNASDVWWLSPDIDLVGPVSGRDNADAGQINPATVTFHRKPAGSNCLFPGDESLVTELWVANPSLVISPSVRHSAAKVGFIGSQPPQEGESGTQQIDWRAAGTASADDPLSPGPKCLVARVYPSSLTPSPATFFVPGDQHVTQHNLCTLAATTGDFTFQVNTCGDVALHPPLPINPTPNAKLRAVLDLNPSPFVKNTVLSRLNSHPGFQLSNKPLKGGFKFDLTNLHATNIVDHSQTQFPPLPLNVNPSFEAKVVLDGKQVITLTFLANLRSLPQNNACIFHLLQENLSNVVVGGLTLVILKH